MSLLIILPCLSGHLGSTRDSGITHPCCLSHIRCPGFSFPCGAYYFSLDQEIIVFRLGRAARADHMFLLLHAEMVRSPGTGILLSASLTVTSCCVPSSLCLTRYPKRCLPSRSLLKDNRIEWSNHTTFIGYLVQALIEGDWEEAILLFFWKGPLLLIGYN